MAIQKLQIVEGNTAPPYEITAQRAGVVINLTNCTVNLVIYSNEIDAVTNTGHQACVVTTPTAGLVTYTAQAGDFPTSGSYICDLVVTYDDATVETLYDQIQFTARLKVGSSS